MVNPLDLASDVISGGAAFAGLIIVYLGGIAAGYDSYSAPQKSSVRAFYRRRAWLACVGVCIAILAAFCGLLGKWWANGFLVQFGAFCLLLALVFGVWTA